MTIKELIRKNKIQADAVQRLVSDKNCTKHEIERYEAVLRFIKGFINDLENIKQ